MGRTRIATALVGIAIAVALALVAPAFSESRDTDAHGGQPSSDVDTADPSQVNTLTSPPVPAASSDRHRREGGWSQPVNVTRSGLHYTPEELGVWRHRALHGPYRVNGDVSPHSPGDWMRIAENTKSFMRTPGKGNRWNGPRGEGCVEPGAPAPPLAGPSRLRDAAFYYLITGDDEVKGAVKSQLLEQASRPGVDFSNREKWCPGNIQDVGPSFTIANWLTKLLYAYDYLGQGAFSEAERMRLNTWFYEAADFWMIELNSGLDRLFENRAAGDYTLTSHAREGGTDIGYKDQSGRGKPIYRLHRAYNNRRARINRFIAVAGAKLEAEGFHGDRGVKLSAMKESAESFVQEWIMFSVFPEGFFGEFERGTDALPDKGWGYAASLLGSNLTVANTYARAGDDDLFQYETTQGALGTEGDVDKSLLFAVKSLGKYIDGTFERYAATGGSSTDRATFRIDTVTEKRDWRSVTDIDITVANIYYRDNYISSMYTRTGAGMPDYPADPAISGQHLAWTGDCGTYPGLLFMYGQLEGIVDPY